MAVNPDRNSVPSDHGQTGDAPGGQPRETPVPLLGWFLGPAAWALQHATGYAMIPWLCDAGRTWPYHVLIGFCVALCGVGALAARSAARLADRARSERSAERLRFMAIGGYILSGGALVMIVLAYGGAVWIGLCAGR